MGPYRAAVDLILVPGTRPVDLLRKLNENQPQVVHFSSHGSPDEIILESADEQAGAGDLLDAGLRSTDERDMTLVRPELAAGGTTPGQALPRALGKSALVKVLPRATRGICGWSC